MRTFLLHYSLHACFFQVTINSLERDDMVLDIKSFGNLDCIFSLSSPNKINGIMCYRCYSFPLFFSYFLHLFSSCSIHLCPLYRLSHFHCTVIILSHRHFFISSSFFHMTNRNVPWSSSLYKFHLPTLISILCKAMLLFPFASLP